MSIRPGIIVEWDESETESGIKLEGPTKARRRGEVISSHAYPMQDPRTGGMGFMVAFVVRRVDTNAIVVINGLEAIVVDEKPERLKKSNKCKCCE